MRSPSPAAKAQPKGKPQDDAVTPQRPRATAASDARPPAKGAPQAAPPSRADTPVRKAAPRAAPEDKGRKKRDRIEELKTEMHHRLLDNLNLGALEKADAAALRAEIVSITSEELAAMGVILGREDREILNSELFDEVMGLGPLEPLLKDESVNDILVNGPHNIYIERSGKLEKSDIRFKDERHLLRIIDKIVSAVGRRVDESNPYVDARLRDGSRFNAMVPPVAVDGSLVSIRKFKKEKLGVDELVQFGAFTEAMATYLQAAVACRLNVVVSGGTGSGKTTTLNALSSFIGRSERDPDDRGHGRTSASAGPCGPHGKPAAQCRRQGRGQRSATASRTRCGCAPDRIIVGRDARRGGHRHAPGDEHRP